MFDKAINRLKQIIRKRTYCKHDFHRVYWKDNHRRTVKELNYCSKCDTYYVV